MDNYNEKIICLNCNNLIICTKNIDYFVKRFNEIQNEIKNKIKLNEKLIFILTENEDHLIKNFRYSIKNKNIECNFCSNKIGYIENYKNYIYGILLNEKIKIKKYKIINNSKILNDFNIYNIKDIIFKNKIQNLFKLDLMRKQYISEIIKKNYIPTREDQIKIENEDFIKKLYFINDNYDLELNK